MAAILRLAKGSPFAFGLVYSGVKTCACDLMVQKVVEKREEIDWRRNSAFAAFGFIYLGGVQYALYVPLFSRLFPNAASFASKSVSEKLRDLPGIRSLFAQVFIDQFVHHPLLYFPVFYMIKDAATSGRPDPIKAINQFRGNFKEDMVALWKVWVPSTFLNFAFMPMYLRIPWVASTSLIWTCILSAMRGGSETMPANEIIGPGIDAASFELLVRTTTPPAPTLAADRAHVLVSVHGPDRPGIVAAVARSVYDAGGNLTTSKMIKLGGEFAVMMHVDCDPDQLGALRENIHAKKFDAMDGCDVQTRQVLQLGHNTPLPAYTANVRLTGPDKPGLLMRLTELLASHGLSVEHIQTEQHVEPKSKSKPRLFSIRGIVTSQTEPDAKAIEASIHELRKELQVTCVIEREDPASLRRRGSSNL
jgi:glycine cleavage system regulatory protein